MPERIQRKRTKGWKKPNEAVYVGRGSQYGNPWRVWRDSVLRRWVTKADHNATSERFLSQNEAHASAVRHFAAWAWRLDVTELAGKDLMCWCPLNAPCHADVLLRLANGGGNVLHVPTGGGGE